MARDEGLVDIRNLGGFPSPPMREFCGQRGGTGSHPRFTYTMGTTDNTATYTLASNLV